MTPKRKAENLVQRFIYRRTDYVEVDDAKQCALIAVDEIMKTFIPNNMPNYVCEEIKYWQEVKAEIEKIK